MKAATGWSLGVAWLVAVILAPPARAQDLEDGWLMPVSWSVAVLEDTPPRSVFGWAACGSGRLFAMPELAQRYLGFETSRGGARLAANWQILGGEAWRERRVQVEAGWGHLPGVRLVWTRRRSESWGVASPARQELAPGLRASLGDRLEITVLAAPVVLGRDSGSSRRHRWLELRGRAGTAAWALTIDRRREDAPTSRVALLARCVPGLALGLQAEPATGTLGLTTAWARGGLVLRSSHLCHPALGITHRWMLLLGSVRR
ncbi:hypothetical protein H8E07_05160 [bacterium]|nr:hypothetical protein [bacterium]